MCLINLVGMVFMLIELWKLNGMVWVLLISINVWFWLRLCKLMVDELKELFIVVFVLLVFVVVCGSFVVIFLMFIVWFKWICVLLIFMIGLFEISLVCWMCEFVIVIILGFLICLVFFVWV